MRRSFALSVAATLVALFASVWPAAPAHAAGIGEQAVLTGLPWPAAFAFAPNGRIFYGERYTGRIMIRNPTADAPSVFYTITRLRTAGEGGLLGLALDPSYPKSPYVYAFATRSVHDVEKAQILRMRYAAGKATSVTVIWTGGRITGPNHVGGRIAFGPDRMLYAIVGDNRNSSNAQDTSTSFGKVLRMTTTGLVPTGNLYPGREYAIGIRNSFGFTFDYAHTGLMWETENGPECNDEINLIRGGDNLGWGPTENCVGTAPQDTNQDGASPVLPLVWYAPTIAPTGTVFCNGCGLTGADDDLFFGTYKTHEIRQVVLTSDRMGVASDSSILIHDEDVLSMERGPSGAIYFSDEQGIFELINT